MTAICVLPAGAVAAAMLEAPLGAVRRRFAAATVDYVCRAEDVAHYTQLLGGHAPRSLPEGRLSGASVVVVMTMNSWPSTTDFDPPLPRPLPLLLSEGQRVAVLNHHGFFHEGVVAEGQVRLGGADIIHDLSPDLDRHVFGRLGPVGQGYGDIYSFTYFPYGYLMRALGTGAVDAFGFRIRADLARLGGRPDNHKVVACFGGSACFSLYCPDGTSFPEVLEERLNAWAAETGRGLTFTVLNFGVPGAVVLNAMTTFMLFGQPLRPDVVIAHDGINDFHYGLTTDPELLVRHAITYPQNLEQWAQILHGSGDRPHSQTAPMREGYCENKASSLEVLRAYVARKRQFQEMAGAAGATFIWGKQAYFGSKRALSPREEAGASGYRTGLYRRQAEVMPILFDMASDNVRHQSGDIVVDLHRRFREFGAETTLLADHVHLLPAGDAVVADAYFEALRRHLETATPAPAARGALT